LGYSGESVGEGAVCERGSERLGAIEELAVEGGPVCSAGLA